MWRTASAFIALVVAAAVPADSASAQATGGRLKTIAGSKTIKIAHRSDAMPFSYVENKEVVGYTIDICKAVVASLEKQLKVQPLKVEWVPVTTQTRFDAVTSGKADLECGSSTVTLSRMKQVDFSNYVFVESTGLVVKSTDGSAKLQDISGKKIAVIAGTSNEKAMAAVNQKAQLNATLVPVKDRDEAVAALESGKADAFASDKLLLVGTQFKDMQSYSHAARRPVGRALCDRAAAWRLGASPCRQHGAGGALSQRRGAEDLQSMVRPHRAAARPPARSAYTLGRAAGVNAESRRGPIDETEILVTLSAHSLSTYEETSCVKSQP